MALSIKSEQADRLAQERRGRGRRTGVAAARLDRLAREGAALPDVDPRSPDEIIGYDEHGVPA